MEPKIPVPAPDTHGSSRVIHLAFSYSGDTRHRTDDAGKIGNELLADWNATGRLDGDLPTLRCALFFEQRRGHWLERLPDHDCIHALLTEIQRLGSGWVDGPATDGPRGILIPDT